MCAAAITCQVVQSKPGKSGWNLWGLRISRGHVHTCLQICGAFLWGGEWKSDYSCLAFLFVMVCFHQKRNLKQVFWQDVVSVRCCEVHQALHVIGA